MKMELKDTERRLFELLSQSPEGRMMEAFLDRMITTMCDVRNFPEGSDKAKLADVHAAAADIIKENLIDNIRDLRTTYEEPDSDDPD